MGDGVRAGSRPLMPLFAPVEAIAIAAVAAAAPSPSPRLSSAARPDPPRGFIEHADAVAIGPLEAFELSGELADARRALEAARRAREELETRRGPRRDADARREELIFLNHVVLGISAYLSEPDRAGARERLASVLRRGRAHRDRALRAPRSGRP